MLAGIIGVSGCFGCGGSVADIEDGTLGTGGQGTTPSNPNGGSTTSTTSPSAPVCYGAGITPAPTNGCSPLGLGTIPANNTACTVPLPIASNYKLSPEKLNLYFAFGDNRVSKIPYIGTLADCASAAATTYGGWYATNIAGGATDIGLCACTCNAAHGTSIVADICM